MLYSPVCIFYFYFYFNDYAFFFFLSVCAKDVKIKKIYISQIKFWAITGFHSVCSIRINHPYLSY